MIPMVPDIFLERPSGIVCLDAKENLIGFNEAFLELLEAGHKNPERLLRTPLSKFLTPTPSVIQQEKTTGVELPPDREFTVNLDCLETVGSLLENQGQDYRYIPLPVDLKGHECIRIDMQVKLRAGTLPLIVLAGRQTTGLYPLGDVFQVGPDIGSMRFVLKRQGIQQTAGITLKEKQRWHLVLYRTGDTIILKSDSNQVLGFYQADLKCRKLCYIYLCMRPGSVCELEKLQVAVRPSPGVPSPAPPVIVRLNTQEQRYFILNRLAHLPLTNSYPDYSLYVLENVTEIKKQVNVLESQVRILQSESLGQDAFIGNSDIINTIRQKAAVVAESDATVLIQGPTGSGKEVMARYIHDQSLRSDAPFVKVDCSVISKTLIESELFGHEKGAFTGAQDRKIGYFEQADHGTLFLDEVGNLSHDMQKKLLQFLQDHTITRVGGTASIPLDVRILVAANVPLMSLVEQGVFRADLYYRMDVVSIFLPPLKDRKKDIPLLCRHFLEEFNQKHTRHIQGLSREAMTKLRNYDWPGNVRELRNILERAVLFCEGEQIGPELVRFSGMAAGPGGRKAHRRIVLDVDQVRELFKKHDGLAKAVAAEMGITTRTLYYKLKRKGYSIEEIRTGMG
jgi:DNA-binding NtrC family response regulator